MKKSILKLFTLFGVLLFSSAVFAQTNIFDDVIATSPDHTKLKRALENTGLDEVLRDNSVEYTVFAPDNDAIDNFSAQLGVGPSFFLNQPALDNLILYHVLGAQILSSEISNGDILTPLNDSNTLKLTASLEGNIFVNQAQVNAADLTADNGVVHSLDAVLIPRSTVVDVAIDNGFTSLTAAVVTAELLPALTDPFADFTVFAPSDAAFDDLAAALGTDIDGVLADPELANILLYHVLDGAVMSSMINNGDIVTPLNDANTIKLTATSEGNVFANQAAVEIADLGVDNGVVHAIDAVLLSSETVVDVAIDNGFTSLTAAVVTAELLPALTDPFADFTVFAPSDAAFDDLAAALGTDIDGVLADPELANILLYHVLDGAVMSSMINNGDIVTPLNDANTIKLTATSEGNVFANQAAVEIADLGVDNGVVHAIDAVLLSSETVVDVAIDNGFTSLTAAVVTAELLPALTDPFADFTVFAPSDAAFDDLAAALGTDIDGVLADPELANILLYHVLDGAVMSSMINNGDIVTPLNDANTIKLTATSEGNVFANQAAVEIADLGVDNGVVHAIDAVLLSSETVVDVAIDNGFTSLTAAVVTAELLPALTDPFADFTVFAPSDAAFDDLAAALGTDIDGVLADPELANILLYHVLDGAVMSSMINNGDIVTPLNDANTIKLTATSEGNVFANQAAVEIADLGVDNGVVHAIDAVLLSSETVVDVAIDNGFTSLTAAVVTAELLPALTDPFADFTVFAPSDAAFDDLAAALGTDIDGVLADPELANILLYHVLDGAVMSSMINNGDIVTPLNDANTIKLTATSEGNVFANQAAVEIADLGVDNGVVHAIDAVLLSSETVVDVAIDNGFTSLTAAVVTAELLPALTDPFADFTVFAPSDAAFDDLAAALGTDIDGVLADPELANILLYHVLDGAVMSSMINNGDIVTPLNDANTIKLTATSEGNVFANQAAVEIADLGVDNGVVHAIDAVLLSSETVVDVAIDNGFTSLTAAVVTAELLPALTDPFADFTVFAPSDAAFDDLAAALGTDIDGVLADPELANILLYHVLDGAVMSSMINNGDIVTPLNDANTIKLTATSEGNVFANQAAVEIADLGVDNGVVHAIDAVLLSSETVVDVAIDNGFTSLTAAVVTAELLPALTDPFADFTVFAPSDAAFDDLAAALGTDIDGVLADPELANILLYHVLDGAVMSSMINNGDIVTPLNDANTIKLTATSEGNVFANQAAVEIADLGVDNGVVHAIDAVLLSSETVVDVAIDNGFTTLTTAVVTAELLPALTDPLASLTVFAPTDEAFDMLAADLDTDVNGLLELPNLADILLYHVVGEDLLSTEFSEGPLTMLNGQSTIIDLSDGVQINNATVTGPDNGAENGIVHIINAVLDQDFFLCESGFVPAPSNLEVIQSQFSEDITFQWDPVPGSVICQLRLQRIIAETSQNITVEADEDGSEPSQITLAQSDFDSNDIYQLRVRCACSLDPLVESSFSDRVLFVPFGDNVIDPPFQGIQTADGINTLSIFPNPSNLGYINLRISNSANNASEGLLEVRDVTGRSIKTLRVAVEANQLLQVETNNIPAGMYTVSYTSGAERVTKRFVIE